jgi:putative Mn2+ efflux pump MntP
MGTSTIFVLSVGLAMDATAVAAALGFAAGVLRPRDVARVAGLFGGAQAVMPLVGWWLGALLGPLVDAYAHSIAFVLLVAFGGKMLREAWSESDVSPVSAAAPSEPFSLRVLLPLTFATSIDAFSIGITLPLLGAPMLTSVLTIGSVTATMSAAGLVVGRRVGARLGRGLDVAGGLVLIGLAVKILLSHA